ncbi:hypothetical protein MASR2M47_29840 [Draconibacterium sp.]|jgi:hypothetical protein
MTEKSNDNTNAREYRKIIAAHTDDEIRQILKKRKLYQKDAADFAIQEAIRRGIIYSEQDLFAKEYKYEPDKFSLFPTIENTKARAKFKKSLTRSLLILGAIPMVLGAIKIFETQIIEGIVLFVLGAAWSLTSFQLMRKLDKKLVYFLFLLFTVALVYIVKTMVTNRAFSTIDILVAIIGVGFVLYGIGFLLKLED